MAGFSVITNKKPKQGAKYFTQIFTDEDKIFLKKQGLFDLCHAPIGIFMPMKRAEITAIENEKLEIYSRDARIFSNYKELKNLIADFC